MQCLAVRSSEEQQWVDLIDYHLELETQSLLRDVLRIGIEHRPYVEFNSCLLSQHGLTTYCLARYLLSV